MTSDGRLLIASRLTVALLLGIWLATGTGCPPPPGPAPGNDNTGDNVNDNTGDNVNDNAADNDNQNDNAGGEVDLFVTSPICTICHGSLTDSLGNDVSIDAHWRPTLMANAATDPLFLASVSSEVQRAPDLRDVIEDTCATCHLPMAYTQADADGTSTRIFDDGLLHPDNPLFDEAIEGVSCTLCHQITDAFLDDPEIPADGSYVIDLTTAPPDRLTYGPYVEPQQPEIMQVSSGYIPVHGPHIEEAALCATCHTLFTPTLDPAGEIVGEFPEQTPFLEWLHGIFGDGLGDDDRTCQSCHMPLAEGEVALSRVPGGLDPRSPFYQHQFVGGNVFMQRLLRDNRETLGLTATVEEFDAAIARTEQFLREQTADLTVGDARLTIDNLVVTLNVANRSGHKFPTSFPSRRAWIHLTVRDDDDNVIFESGAFQTDGAIVGNAADENAALFESHYDTITSPDQVQIYEPIMENTDGEVTYALLRAAAYAKDNRLLPAGFDKATAEEDIAVWGAAAVDANFVAGSDTVTYRVPIDPTCARFTVTAELLYQSASYRYVTDVREESTPPIDEFGDFYDAADKTPSLIAHTEVEVRGTS